MKLQPGGIRKKGSLEESTFGLCNLQVAGALTGPLPHLSLLSYRYRQIVSENLTLALCKDPRLRQVRRMPVRGLD